MPAAFLLYTGLWNQGFAKVYLVASCAAIVLWSVAILRGASMPRGAAIAGLVLAGAILLAFFAGHLGLDVHGFGIMTLAQFDLAGVDRSGDAEGGPGGVVGADRHSRSGTSPACRGCHPERQREAM